MTKIEDVGKLIEDAIEEWRLNKGVGTAFVPNTINDKVFVLGILQRIYQKSPTINTLIIVETFNERTDLVEFITHQENDDENNAEFKRLLDNKRIVVFTSSYLDTIKLYNVPMLCILYKPSTMTDKVSYVFEKTKFKFCVINNLLSTSEDTAKLYKLCPILQSFQYESLQAVRTSTPVEETRVGIALDEDSEDSKLLKYYDLYITTSLNIFGSFDKLQEAYKGNQALNISSLQICNSIARDNGWDEHLDMSIPYNQQIDELYNPISIRDRAFNTYEMIRLRSRLLSDNKAKLEVIYNFIKEHKDEKILIINKRGSFAKEVTDYINNLSETTICGDYHDNLEPIPASDVYGNPIFIKSGKNKGERKFHASQSQKTINVKRFNEGLINVLSTNNMPDKELNIKIDHILISSPQCLDIKVYLYRLDKVLWPPSLKLCTLYINNSFEEKQLSNKEVSDNHTIVKNVNSCDTTDNFSGFIVDD